jgi:hypothetical protein
MQLLVSEILDRTNSPIIGLVILLVADSTPYNTGHTYQKDQTLECMVEKIEEKTLHYL